MRKVHSVLILGFSVGGCIFLPANGTPQESSNSTSLVGYGWGASQPISVRVRNWNNDANSALSPNAVTGTTESYAGSGLYPWSKTVPAQGINFWRPNLLGPGTEIAMGRLEISAFQQENQLLTFSEEQQDCALAQVDAGVGQSTAGQNCSDGEVVARFDNSGFGQPALTSNTFFVHSQNIVAAPTWSLDDGSVVSTNVGVKIVRYTSPGASQVWAMICAPPDATPTPRRLMVINHGGNAGTFAPDAFACLQHARRGWVVAMPSYRGEPLYVPDEDLEWSLPGLTTLNWASWNMRVNLQPPPPGWTPPPVSQPPVARRLLSNGTHQTSLGEVMDVHRLLQLMLLQPNVHDDKVLMWGTSHGGAITLRAVESAAPVHAAIAIAPATDWSDVVQDCLTSSEPVCQVVLNGADLTALVPPLSTYVVSSVPTQVGDTTPMPPGGTFPIQRSYQWRSPLFFAKDLKIRRDVTLLIQHGDADDIVQPHQSCELAVSGFRSDDAGRKWYTPLAAVPGTSIGVAHPECPGFTFSSTPRPPFTPWERDRSHFILYGGYGHGGLVGAQLDDFRSFLQFIEASFG